MSQVYVDRIEDSGIQETEDSLKIVRTFFVCGVEGEGAEILPNALTAPGIPAMFTSHPEVALCILRERAVKPKSNNQALVVCTYIFQTNKGEFQGPVWEVENSLISEQTSYDSTGKKILVPWDQTKSLGLANPTPIVNGLFPTVTLRGTAFERQSPYKKSIKYTGKVNSSTWAEGDKHTWMCMGINGTKLAKNLWQVTYIFQYRPLTWKTLVVVRGTDGRVPQDAAKDLNKTLDKLNVGESGNGWLVVLLYKALDFNAFGEPTVF